MNLLTKKIIHLKKFFRVFIALLTTQYALMLEYRAEIALWAISGILPLIMLGLWSDTNAGNYYGVSNSEITSYFISAFFVRQFTVVWVMFSFEEDNIEGRLSPFLLQPIKPFWRYLTSHLAEQFTRIPFVFLILLLVYLVLPRSIWFPSAPNFLVGIIAIFLAFIVRFLLHWTFSMLCFWNERVSAIEKLLLIPYLFLSGLLAPIEAFPPMVRTIAMATPYPYLLSFPSKIISGQDVNILNVFMVLIGWGVFFLTLSIFAWRKGVRHYSAMGA